MVRNSLGDLEVFLENLYAVHSIQYRNLQSHFYVFAVREGDTWLSWEETKFYAAMLDLPTVPEIKLVRQPLEKTVFEADVLAITAGRGSLEPYDVLTGKPTVMEGVVTRNTGSYTVGTFAENVFKYVRKGHVKTDEHWTRHWRRAPLINEGGHYVGDK
jgi:hypothetical protein